MRVIVILILLLTCAGVSSAEYMFGMKIDTSSNMLMRPDGTSGTLTSMFGDASFTSGDVNFSYGLEGGMLEHYEGVQFHYHKLDISYSYISSKNVLYTAGMEYDIARYSDATVLKGYNQYGIAARVKSYLSQSLLLRCEGKIRRRSYRFVNNESYSEGEAFVRLDRFFNSGTTLRFQLDLGIRRYYEQPSSSKTFLSGVRIRAARSLGERWGMCAEVHNRSALYYPSQESSPENIPGEIFLSDGSPAGFDRVFLDDNYKYSSDGFLINTKYLLRHSGKIQFESSIVKKTYDGSQTSLYWYLPENGWDEWEWGVFFTIAYRPAYIPTFVHPACEVYHISVDASESYLSYDTTGVSIRFELY